MLIDPRTAVLVATFPSITIALVNGWYKAELYALQPAGFWAADIGQFVVVPAASLWWLWRAAGVGPRDYGFLAPARRGEWVRLAGLTALVSAVFLVCYLPLVAPAGRLLHETVPEFDYGKAIPELSALKLVTVGYYALTAALVEETMFRALPWLWFSRVYGRDRAVVSYTVASSILFGWIHWENGMHEVVVTALLGAVACLLYARIRNVWPFVGAHFVTDVVSFWR